MRTNYNLPHRHYISYRACNRFISIVSDGRDGLFAIQMLRKFHITHHLHLHASLSISSMKLFIYIAERITEAAKLREHTKNKKKVKWKKEIY